MIGFMITGHGTYAPGMHGAMEMIAGTQEKVRVIPFLQGMTLEEFQDEMVSSINFLKQEVNEIVIFTDLLGGTPFKTAAEQALFQQNIEVVSGTNLSMLIEGTMLRLGVTSASEFVDQLLQTGKEGINKLEIINAADESLIDDFSEGI